MEVGGKLHARAALSPSIHLIVDCVDLRARFDTSEKRAVSWPCRESNHVSSVVQPIAYLRDLNVYENGLLIQLLLKWGWTGSGMHVMPP
jgi:hypothetical protein